MSVKNVYGRIRNKRDTSANWENNNPVLLNGELIVVDTNARDVRFKIGDGSKTYTQLPFTDEKINTAINEHINDTIVHWTADDRAIFSNVTSENYVSNNNATLLTDAGNAPIKNLIVTTKEETSKVYVTICGKNIANITTTTNNSESMQTSSVLPVTLPFVLGGTNTSTRATSLQGTVLPVTLPFILGDNETNEGSLSKNVLLPKEHLILYINEGFKFSVQFFKDGEVVLENDFTTSLSIDNTSGLYDEMAVSFATDNGDNTDINNVKFMTEIGETATGYEPYRGYTVVYESETVIASGEIVDLTNELQNFNTIYGVTNVISNCNVSFDYNQLKETFTDDWLYSRGGKVITTLATDYECGLMSSEDKKKLNSLEIATDEQFRQMMISIGLY